MSFRRTMNLLLGAAATACLLWLVVAPAMAAPSPEQTAADRVAVARAVEQYAAVQAQSARIDASVVKTSAQLDLALAQETEARDRLRSRLLAIYRSDDTSYISMLLGASTLQDFVSRWDLLTRIAAQDAKDLAAAKAARIKAHDAAERLLELQAEDVQSLEAVADEVARAKKKLAASQAALAAYESQTTVAPKPALAPRTDSTQKLTGSGAWQTAVASHYGRNFTGRGASGETIGPYSMIVAHKTLPFGTLIEFEYRGKRAVAKVADRGPYTAGREFDLGPGVVRVLGFSGVHEVRYRIIGR
ncbi:MAG: septal ring lytic transglycosylase RlpA family protein [Coriobacteriia bacterium]|nr:septal ring lytic transglycosylase RlpA family protein [Coriobacteriia bacterium]